MLTLNNASALAGFLWDGKLPGFEPEWESTGGHGCMEEQASG